MSGAARQLAIVRRAAFGRLPSGEPNYDPPITSHEVEDMREVLKAADSLYTQDSAADEFVPFESRLTVRSVSLIRRALVRPFPAGKPEPE